MLSNQQLLDEQTTAISVSEHLFDEEVHLTGITEYGISWADLTSGQAALPPEGARFDIYFEGTFEGPKLKGTISGVDFLTVRADGRFQLDLHATLTTDDGVKIAVYEDGPLIPPKDERRIAELRLNLEFYSSSPKYAWLNHVQGWARGTVNWNNGEIEVQVYAA